MPKLEPEGLHAAAHAALAASDFDRLEAVAGELEAAAAPASIGMTGAGPKRSTPPRSVSSIPVERLTTQFSPERLSSGL